MIVRNPTPGEVERAAEVASIAFPNLSLERWQESFATIAELFGEQFILVAEVDQEIVSSLLCTLGPIKMGDALISHSAVGAVGTLPDYRRMGCAGAMMTQSVKLLRKEGICASSLWPFSYPYYRKFGWEVGAESRAYSGPASVFVELGDPSNARPATPDDMDAVKTIYHVIARSYCCLTERSDEWWTRIIRIGEYLKSAESGCGILLHSTEGRPDSYAVYATQVKDEKTAIHVKEMMFWEPDQRVDMLAFLAAMSPESQIHFGTPVDDSFLHHLPDPRAVHTSIEPSFQFRIIDPEQAMLALTPMEHVSGQVSFSLSDPVFKHGFQFGIEVEDGEVALCKADPGSLIETDIQTMAKMYSGYLSPMDAWDMGKLRIAGNAALAVVTAGEVFGVLTPYRSWLEPG